MKKIVLTLSVLLLSYNAWSQQSDIKIEQAKLLFFDARINQWVDPYYDVLNSTQPNRFPSWHERSGELKKITSYQINEENKEECVIAYEGQGQAILYKRSFNPMVYKYEWQDITPLSVQEKKNSIERIVIQDGSFKELKVVFANGASELLKL